MYFECFYLEHFNMIYQSINPFHLLVFNPLFHSAIESHSFRSPTPTHTDNGVTFLGWVLAVFSQ